MTLNREFIGRSHRMPEIYEGSREKIREFAIATGDTNPVYLDPEAAKACGHPDVIAPPTFAQMLPFRLGSWPLLDPEFGKNKLPVCVLRGQTTTYRRPIRPGDLLVLTTTVDDIHNVGGHEQFELTHEIATVDGELVCVVLNRVISRGTANPDGGR
jgi:acyl dehydratase